MGRSLDWVSFPSAITLELIVYLLYLSFRPFANFPYSVFFYPIFHSKPPWVYSVILPLDWINMYIFPPLFKLYRINFSSFISFSGEELWIGAIEPRPQEWPGGYPGDLGEVIARGRSGWDRRRTREAEEEAAMNASVNVERNSWRLPPDETVQVADPRSKSAQVKEVNRSTGSPSGPSPNRRVRVADCTVRFRCM